jgi:hypothetical protein
MVEQAREADPLQLTYREHQNERLLLLHTYT